MFTLRQFYQHLKQAYDTFEKACPNELYRTALKRMVYTIKIDSRLRTKAGEASWSRNRASGVVKLSMRVSSLLMQRASHEEQFQTISHELAHLLELAVHNDTNHKARWKQLHMWMGGDGKRCHDISVENLGNKVVRIMVTDTKLNKNYFLRRRAYERQKANLAITNLEEPGRYKSKIVRVNRYQLKNA